MGESVEFEDLGVGAEYVAGFEVLPHDGRVRDDAHAATAVTVVTAPCSVMLTGER